MYHLPFLRLSGCYGIGRLRRPIHTLYMKDWMGFDPLGGSVSVQGKRELVNRFLRKPAKTRSLRNGLPALPRREFVGALKAGQDDLALPQHAGPKAPSSLLGVDLLRSALGASHLVVGHA